MDAAEGDALDCLASQRVFVWPSVWSLAQDKCPDGGSAPLTKAHFERVASCCKRRVGLKG